MLNSDYNKIKIEPFSRLFCWAGVGLSCPLLLFLQYQWQITILSNLCKWKLLHKTRRKNFLPTMDVKKRLGLDPCRSHGKVRIPFPHCVWLVLWKEEGKMCRWTSCVFLLTGLVLWPPPFFYLDLSLIISNWFMVVIGTWSTCLILNDIWIRWCRHEFSLINAKNKEGDMNLYTLNIIWSLSIILNSL